MTDGRTEAIAISPTLFKKKRGDNEEPVHENFVVLITYLHSHLESVDPWKDAGSSPIL